MRPKSKREEAILTFVAATVLIVLFMAILGTPWWGMVGMVVVMLVGAFFAWAESQPRL